MNRRLRLPNATPGRLIWRTSSAYLSHVYWKRGTPEGLWRISGHAAIRARNDIIDSFNTMPDTGGPIS